MSGVEPLWERFIAWDNLILAAAEARRHKRARPAVAEFEERREENLAELRAELVEGAYRPDRYRTFEIRDPKPRLICAPDYRDRIVHHALMRVVAPLLERSFTYTNFACRLGKGAHRAVRYVQRLTRRCPFALKLDVRKFYPTIDHAVLKDLLARKIADTRLRAVIGAVIDSYDSGTPGKGLPIGALTSQWFALLYLDPVDHELTDRLRAKGYARYMDDMIVLGNSKAELRFLRDRAIEALARLQLQLHPGKRSIHRVAEGIPFLGFRIYPSHLRVLGRGKVRARRKMRLRRDEWARGERTTDSIRSSVASWVGHWRWADSYYLRKSIFRQLLFSRARG